MSEKSKKALEFLRRTGRLCRRPAQDMAAALALLTRLPVPASAHARPPRANWAFCAAGLAAGVASAAAFTIARAIGLPEPAAGLLAVLAATLLTGGLHEDGLADTADGLGGGKNPPDRLRIMRDSRIGAYGALALIFSVSLRAAALAALPGTAAVWLACAIGPVWSRAALVGVMRFWPAASGSGLAAAVERPGSAAVVITLLAAGLPLGVFMALGLADIRLAAACLAATLPALLLAMVAARRLGGYTGDTLGAVQQVCETALLLVCAALLGEQSAS